MSKRKYRFGLEYFLDWTLDQILDAGYTIVFDGEEFSAKVKER